MVRVEWEWQKLHRRQRKRFGPALIGKDIEFHTYFTRNEAQAPIKIHVDGVETPRGRGGGQDRAFIGTFERWDTEEYQTQFGIWPWRIIVQVMVDLDDNEVKRLKAFGTFEEEDTLPNFEDDDDDDDDDSKEDAE